MLQPSVFLTSTKWNLLRVPKIYKVHRAEIGELHWLDTAPACADEDSTEAKGPKYPNEVCSGFHIMKSE